MASPTTWIAGPTQYWEGDYDSFDLAWDFVGGNAAYQIRRWRLRYKAAERVFKISDLKADRGDQAHATAIRQLYAGVMVRGDRLPKGPVIEKLKAMLSPQDIAAATRLSIAEVGKS